MPAKSSAAAGARQNAAPVAENFEAALGELERLVAGMEAGQLPLDELLENYQRGARLIAFCRNRLQQVEQQVQVLEDGELKAAGAGLARPGSGA